MEQINSFDEWLGTLEEEGTLLLFVKTDNCSVCEGLLPQVAPLEEEYAFPFYLANAAQVPELAGQLSLFTAPVVLLFKEGREFARFARFVPMAELKQRMDELELAGGQYE
ncbi:thioredoxin family protein [Bhargavaea beijingensis]|uniref:Thioredoxin n=1 Tax=Bhargavaea beijingensis TaxID=426756 RepID=A0A1G7DGT7_9BACL|nr:thioredoxin family protein [Bhargavaea beijingensis]MCW1927191.1 thioredoxin family protein [Bhargavaea beijingensis]RSK30910.1 thioredoxin [Bhargavaea beijingensis]SDE50723.1 Thioredoxin [Bhargavaea beijingensis]